ncbi:MAG: methyltransferase domain-containing protein [Gemmatimonadetes bacterium]|nr:methyltransferase domain-containing protein [Gemmatimonadota bacterium]
MSSEQDVAHFFDDFSKTFDTFYENQRGALLRWVDHRFRSDMYIRFARTFEAFGDLRNRTVVDIGCGSGIYTLEALRRGATQVTAIDPAPGMLALVRERVEREGFAAGTEIREGFFPMKVPPHDFAIVMGVMDYIADPLKFLEGLRSVVTDCAAVSFSSRHWFRTPFRKVRYRIRNCPVFFYTEDSIRAMSQSAGFSHIQIYKISGAGMDYHVCLKP